MLENIIRIYYYVYDVFRQPFLLKLKAILSGNHGNNFLFKAFIDLTFKALMKLNIDIRTPKS